VGEGSLTAENRGNNEKMEIAKKGGGRMENFNGKGKPLERAGRKTRGLP